MARLAADCRRGRLIIDARDRGQCWIDRPGLGGAGIDGELQPGSPHSKPGLAAGRVALGWLAVIWHLSGPRHLFLAHARNLLPHRPWPPSESLARYGSDVRYFARPDDR